MKKDAAPASSRLTRIIKHVKIIFMNTKVMTPETWKEIDNLADNARQARDEQIRKMRESDPKYWTFERLAKHWGTKKQNIDYIINGDPRKKKE